MVPRRLDGRLPPSTGGQTAFLGKHDVHSVTASACWGDMDVEGISWLPRSPEAEGPAMMFATQVAHRCSWLSSALYGLMEVL